MKTKLTTATRARITGNPKAETTIPVVKKYASSRQALLAASESYVALLAMKWGMGEMAWNTRTNKGQYTLPLHPEETQRETLQLYFKLKIHYYFKVIIILKVQVKNLFTQLSIEVHKMISIKKSNDN